MYITSSKSQICNVLLKTFSDLSYLKERITPPRYMAKRNKYTCSPEDTSKNVHSSQKRNKYTCSPEDTSKNVPSGTVCNIPQLGTTQMLINSRTDKYMAV